MNVDCDGFEVETLINLRIHKANLKIVEVASFEYSRVYGESNLRAFRDGWRVLKTILKEWRTDILPKHEPIKHKILESVNPEK